MIFHEGNKDASSHHRKHVNGRCSCSKRPSRAVPRCTTDISQVCRSRNICFSMAYHQYQCNAPNDYGIHETETLIYIGVFLIGSTSTSTYRAFGIRTLHDIFMEQLMASITATSSLARRSDHCTTSRSISHTPHSWVSNDRANEIPT